MKKIILLIVLLAVVGGISVASTPGIYQLKIYHLSNQQQEKGLDNFLKSAYIPALHRAEINTVGVFKEVVRKNADEILVYVLVPFSTFDASLALEKSLLHDQVYLQKGKQYLEAPHNEPAFSRIETILLKAFQGSPFSPAPKLKGPKEKRIYELRSYEGPSEKLYRNKVAMFIDGDEIGLFKRLGFNAVFYGEVLAGSKMPNLMYMTTFENQADRDAHWDAFGKDAYWKTLSSDPQYQNNVSLNEQLYLYPTEYSDI